jgi:DNA-binding response OmpR family regulator
MTASKHPIVLLLEDSLTTGLVIERMILNHLPEVRLLWARTIADATTRVDGLPIALFLVDIFLPDGSGLDFLWSKVSTHPEAQAIVMTSTLKPDHELQAAALNAIQLIEKPVRAAQLLEFMRFALDLSADGPAEPVFHATLKKVTPADVLQLKCLTRATTILEFHSEGRTGRIRIEDGEVTDATTGNLGGLDAAFEILGWKGGQMHEKECVGFVDRTIDSPWHDILMEAAQRQDENAAG